MTRQSPLKVRAAFLWRQSIFQVSYQYICTGIKMYHSFATDFCMNERLWMFVWEAQGCTIPFHFRMQYKNESWPFNAVALLSSKSKTTAPCQLLLVHYKYILTQMLHIIWFWPLKTQLKSCDFNPLTDLKANDLLCIYKQKCSWTFKYKKYAPLLISYVSILDLPGQETISFQYLLHCLLLIKYIWSWSKQKKI